MTECCRRTDKARSCALFREPTGRELLQKLAVSFTTRRIFAQNDNGTRSVRDVLCNVTRVHQYIRPALPYVRRLVLPIYKFCRQRFLHTFCQDNTDEFARRSLVTLFLWKCHLENVEYLAFDLFFLSFTWIRNEFGSSVTHSENIQPELFKRVGQGLREKRPQDGQRQSLFLPPFNLNVQFCPPENCPRPSQKTRAASVYQFGRKVQL